MRILVCIIALCFCVLFSFNTEATISYHDTHLVYNIKPNPIIRSKPTSLIKLASVQFLSDSNRISFDKGEVDVKTECAALGFVIPVSECASPMVPSYLCSSELSREGANQYTTGCCNSNLYTAATMDSCTNNATALDDSCYWGGSKKYRCACDRSRYPYSDLDGEGCGNNGDFNVNNKCMAPDATGKQISYYTNCCPTSYEECDASKHMVGSGNSCRVETSKGNIIHKYEECVCSSNYQTPCSGNMLIDGSDYCRYNNTLYTRENNCESSCDQTRETNVDSYLYNNVWHCLYRNDGAIIKDAEEENKLCRGYNYQTSTEEDDYYDDCIAQGFIKSKEDCYVSDLILECPNDSTKVWCVDSKYCTEYPVGNIGNTSACNDGAKIDYCGSRDQGTRCRYSNDECNKCWNDGTYTAGNCQNLDTSSNGDSEKCCQRGYRMENGICVVNVCDRTQFPYDTNPGNDQGELELCYQGNPNVNGGYDVYYGYASCYTKDNSVGGMWKQVGTSGADARKCICDRQDDERGWLPFGVDRYFDSNANTSSDYIYVGFNKGAYGEQNSCTDSEGSYYGYKSCYIGRVMGTSTTSKGMCLPAPAVGAYEKYLYQDINRTTLARMLGDFGESYSTTCINKYTYCEDINGKKVGDESACAMVVAGCNTGNEQACNECYSISNLTKNAQGLWTAHNKFKLIVNWHNNGSGWLGVEECPVGYMKTTHARKVCYKYCKMSDLAKCYIGDILVDDANNNYKVGLVHSTGVGTVYIQTYGEVKSLNWYDADAYARGYYPGITKGNTYYQNHSILGAGKWSLLPYGARMGDWQVFAFWGITATEGISTNVVYMNFWYQTNEDDRAYVTIDYNGYLKDKSSNYFYAIPTLLLRY